MKKVIALFAAFAVAIAAFAQTPEEIANKMNEVMDKLEDNGVRMTMDIKFPILGTTSTTMYTLGNKMRMEWKLMGKKVVTWIDGRTSWTYMPELNTVTINNGGSQKPSRELKNMEMFEDVTEGYDVFLKNETDKAWYLQFKKNKSNNDKNTPKTVDFVVEKGTYYPISMSTKMSGMTLTVRDFKYNITEKQVTFNMADYPGVTIIDERK